MHLLIFFFIFFFFLPIFSPDPINPTTIQPLQPFHLNPSSPKPPPATIPAFPEQSNLASACPLNLPNQLFQSIKTSCSSNDKTPPHFSRCCPVLAAWLFSAYSSTALATSASRRNTTSSPYDMPLLPDDSETCVEDLGKELKRRGVEMVKPNETCDVVYCYCGIRLHPLSCNEAFGADERGKLVGDENVRRLERDCLSHAGGIRGCNKCLKSLYKLNSKKALASSKREEDRTTKMHNKDCQLMGLTWLLAKNHTAYIHTVTSVLRAIMVSPGGSDPQSCTLGSDGMPLAVDSSELSDQSSTAILRATPLYVFFILSLSLISVILHRLTGLS